MWQFLRYLRINTFYRLLRPFSQWSRAKRMRSYTALMGIREGMSIIDLGGQPMIWTSVPLQLNLTILNMPGVAERNTMSHHKIRYVEGDACEVNRFEAQSF